MSGFEANLLQQLQALAKKSPMKFKIAAVLVHRGKIISKGFNGYRQQIHKSHYGAVPISAQCDQRVLCRLHSS